MAPTGTDLLEALHRGALARHSRRDLLRTGIVTTSAASVAGIAGGGTRPAAAQEATPASPAAEAGTAIPRETVLAAIPELETLIQETVDSNRVPGISVAIVHEDEVVYTGGFGVRDTATGEAVDADTVFQIASLSKPISSTAIAGLVGKGLVGWDDLVIDHLPDFRFSDVWATNEITIRDCFSHRTGLPGIAGDDLEAYGFQRPEILHRLRYLELASSPRSTYAYSNFGMTLGGESAATAAGMAWEEVTASQVFEPLGMAASSSRNDDFNAAANKALIHVLDENSTPNSWGARFPRDADPQAPAGGVSTSARDLGEWVRLILGEGTVDGEEIIPADAIAEILTPHIHSGTDRQYGSSQFYGLGWTMSTDDRGRTVLGHAGAFSLGSRTVVRLLPAASLGIVVLVNAFPSGAPEGIAASFFELVEHGDITQDWLTIWDGLYQGLYDSFGVIGETYETPPAAPSAALANAAYLGTYRNDYFGEIEIAEAGDGLELHIGPGPEVRPLTHWDRDVFTYVPFPEPPAPQAGVIFEIGPDGVGRTVRLEDLAEGPGFFVRVEAE